MKPNVPAGLLSNAEEQERSYKLRDLCQGAFLGTGLISVISVEGEGRVQLTFREYNRARGDHPDLVRTMSAMMKKNVCLSSAHPLVAAVDKNLINTTALLQYNPSQSRKESLNVVTFPNVESPPVAILNGRLRVLATRTAFQALSSQREKLQVHINQLEEYFNDSEDRAITPGDRRMKAKLNQAKDDHKNVQQTLKNIQFWPVYFYDEGLITSSMGSPTF